MTKEAETKECFCGTFDCKNCTAVEGEEWRKACKRQCEYNWKHRNDPKPAVDEDDDAGYDMAGQYRTDY